MSKEINLVNVDYRFKRNGKAYRVEYDQQGHNDVIIWIFDEGDSVLGKLSTYSIGDADDAEALLRGTLRKKPAKF